MVGDAAETVLGRRRRVAFVLFAALFVLYQSNLTELDEGDCVTTLNLPIAVLADGRLSFDPMRFPEMFKWRTKAPFAARSDFFFTSFADSLAERTAWEWHESGHLEFNGPRYYAVASKRPGVFVGVFGPIPGLLLLPVMAPFYAVDPLLFTKPAVRNAIAKLLSSGLVAMCATLIFLLAARRVSTGRALLVAAAYGVGSCAWAVSSQNLWQQTVTQALLTCGAFFFLGNPDRRTDASLAGFFFGAAAACRPTSALPLALCAAYIAWRHRRSLGPFLIAALPIPIAIAFYNYHYFGSPFTFAQELVGHEIALDKTGSPALFQTPLWRGAMGLLGSPSRGMLFYSPILLPAFWGMLRTFSRRELTNLHPLGVASVLMMGVQCKWFDWWGGHTYGYRPWLDVIPYLSLFLIPVVEDLTRKLVPRALVGGALGWSAFVQALGAFAYDRSWNDRALHVVEFSNGSKPLALYDELTARQVASDRDGVYVGQAHCDVDRSWCRYRLWSFGDNPISYQLAHFRRARLGRSPEGFGLLFAKSPADAHP